MISYARIVHLVVVVAAAIPLHETMGCPLRDIDTPNFAIVSGYPGFAIGAQTDRTWYAIHDTNIAVVGRASDDEKLRLKVELQRAGVAASVCAGANISSGCYPWRSNKVLIWYTYV